MDKNVALSDEELELLITSLHCVDERSYNFYTTTYIHKGTFQRSGKRTRCSL